MYASISFVARKRLRLNSGVWLTLGQLAGIALFAIWGCGIATKAQHDILDIMRQYAGEFWRRFMEYLIKNIGGG